jgi:7,8-dihydroneopterin aldolase/epimerase/oxygenase
MFARRQRTAAQSSGRQERTSGEARPAGRDVIRLMGISAVGYHGVFEAEKREGQPFAVDVVMHVDVAEAAAADDLTKTVNYAEVADLVAGFIMGESFDLIETLADRIARTLLESQPLTDTVEVTVHKPQAPLPHEFLDVQVTVVRDRADLEAAR